VDATLTNDTAESLDRFSVIREWDIDLLLLEELICNRGFSQWFYESVRQRVSRLRLPEIRPVVCEARHSVNYVGDGSGESDIEATFRGVARSTPDVVMLLEDKIGAQFTEGQPERYAARCAEIAKTRKCHGVTVLVAPSGYLSNTAMAAFDASISYEEVMEQVSGARSVDAQELTARRRHRALMLRHAIEKHRRGGIRVNCDTRTDFFADYEAELARRQPTLRARPHRGRTAESRGFFFDVSPRLRAPVRQLNMMHALDKGFVFLQFRGWGEARDYFVPLFRKAVMDRRMTVDAPIKYNYIEVSIRGLPRLELRKPLRDQLDAAHAAMDAAALILKWYQSNVENLDSWAAKRPESRG
jgi:hypothetical protein